MKLNLLLENILPLNSYINIYPFNIEGQTQIVQNDIVNLDTIADDNECLEILAINILEYLPYNQISNVIQSWVKKLRSNGELIIGGNDLSLLAKQLNYRSIDYKTAQEVLYGRQTQPWEFKKYCSNLYELINIIQSLGLKITGKSILDNKYSFILKVQR